MAVFQTKAVGLFALTTSLVIGLPQVGHLFRPISEQQPWRFPADIPGPEKPGFSVTIFIVIALLFLYISLLSWNPIRYAAFGKPLITVFATSNEKKKIYNNGRLPWYFYPAAVSLVFWLWIHWYEPPESIRISEQLSEAVFGDKNFLVLQHFSFTPLWWSKIIVLDAIVHARCGFSVASKHPFYFFIVTNFFSCAFWLVHDFLQSYGEYVWWYPVTEPVWPRATHFIAFGTAIPSVIEWHCLLQTTPWSVLHTNGVYTAQLVRLFHWDNLSMLKVLLASSFLSVLYGYLASPLFWWMELGNVFFFGTLCAFLRIPASGVYQLIQNGNWSIFTTTAWAGMYTGVFYEMFNFGTGPASHNPNFWVYDVPYVNVLKVFEMPVLGYAGYLVLGVALWESWVLFSACLGVQLNPDLCDYFGISFSPNSLALDSTGGISHSNSDSTSPSSWIVSPSPIPLGDTKKTQ